MELMQPQFKRAQTPTLEFTTETGFQSPAHDYRVKSLSLDELLIRSPASTFFVRVDHSDIDGIEREDILVVNRAHALVEGRVAIMVIDGEFVLRRLRRYGQTWLLQTDTITQQQKIDPTMICWGIVDAVIRTCWS
jgi:DNA polymerase V